MTTLAEKIGERHVWPYDPLAASAEYVEKQLAASGYAVMRQEFLVGERGVANTEVVITGRSHAEGFDLPDRLDYAATARVVTGLCHVILDLAGTGVSRTVGIFSPSDASLWLRWCSIPVAM